MKTFTYISILIALFGLEINAQQNTVITANTNEISDNLDLRAVASIFGESEDLGDFERRLNDPSLQISNLDLNQDNQVDYLRVVEVVEGNLHLVIIQAVLNHDLLQDVATIEIEKENRNRSVSIQIVGNSYFYGSNYIYEPVYVRQPIVFNYFWRPNYVAYYSPWNWGYYPTYYYAWSPYPIYRYHANVGYYVNYNNHCNFVNYRRNAGFATVYNHHHRGSYERQYPNRSFSARNSGYANRYEMRQTNRTSTGRSSIASNDRTNTRATVSNRNSGTSTRSTVSNRNQTSNSNVSNRNSGTSTRSSENNSVRTSSTRNNSTTTARVSLRLQAEQ
jgi:hypothetical protein